GDAARGRGSPPHRPPLGRWRRRTPPPALRMGAGGQRRITTRDAALGKKRRAAPRATGARPLPRTAPPKLCFDARSPQARGQPHISEVIPNRHTQRSRSERAGVLASCAVRRLRPEALAKAAARARAPCALLIRDRPMQTLPTVTVFACGDRDLR